MSKTPSKIRPVVNESGIAIKPLYTAEDVLESGGIDASAPGQAPFTRGIHPLMYRQRPWTMRQYTGFANAADTNKRFKYLIANGQTGLNVAFDLATQCGFDSDAPEAVGEVGRVGMAIDTLKDFEIAFDGIDLDAITVSLTINGTAAILIAMYLAMAEKRGYDVTRLRGTAQNDILKEFIGRGTWIYPVDPSVKLVADTIEQEGHDGQLVAGGKRCIRALEGLDVFGAVIRRQAHAHQHHLAAGGLGGADDGLEVRPHLRYRQPAQTVVGTQRDHGDFRLVLLQRGFDARGAAAGGLPADAGIRHGIIDATLVQAFAQQRHPAIFLADAIGG